MSVERVAVVGAGVIGRAWTALFLARGLDVVVVDPSPDALDALPAWCADATATLRLLEHADVADGAQERPTGPTGHIGMFDGQLTLSTEVGDAGGADLVQECGPEDDAAKAALFADLDRVTPAGVPLVSSSSTHPPSRLAGHCARHPERVVVGHPFNPAHLVPLVEVVGGPYADPAVVDRVVAFYTALGKHPIRLQQEVPGHLANRLQAALWREAYSLVERGVASVADVDAAIAHGPGLRWALLGPLANQHLSGGSGGLRHVLAHLGPPTDALMDDLGDPRLTPRLVELLARGVDDELAGVPDEALAADRDRLLLDLLRAKRGTHLP